MRMQNTQADCGPYSLLNALRARGIHRGSDELTTLAGTTAQNGTSVTKLLKAAKSLSESCGLVPWRIRENRAEIARSILVERLSAGRPCLCVVDEGMHWVAVVGLLGPNQLLVADSADAELVVGTDIAAFMNRWRYRSGTPNYEGIVL